MHEEFLMGNEAIAMGALAAGVNLVTGYPGTPSSEVIETISKRRTDSTYVEWSVNEKAAMEVAAGAAYTGARALVTMKQVGLNVASDPLMSLEYIGVKGGMVVLVADDPGPISSQTEQDTRQFAAYSKLPCLDPSSAKEAYEMIQEAFELSEKYGTPVFLRPTTRVCHGYASLSIKDENEYKKVIPEGFVKDTNRWVIFPRLSRINHEKIEYRNEELKKLFSESDLNRVYPADTSRNCRKGIVTGGISYTYVMESGKQLNLPEVLKIGTPFPFPEELAVKFLSDKDEVLVVEELHPVLEEALLLTAGKYHIPVTIRGKLTHDMPAAGENSRDLILKALDLFMDNAEPAAEKMDIQDAGQLPIRPPVLCAGCPHRASFYAVKQAMKGRKTIYCGDIGCYTLGNAKPLDMTDTCLCMGAGLGIAQGVGRIEPDTVCFAFVGDSTFFASAITGAVNAVYNQANMTLVVLDNSTTAMTGHQPHPGTGRTMMGDIVDKIDITAVLKGVGVKVVETVDPLRLAEAVNTVKRVADLSGVKAIIFKSPCIALFKPQKAMIIDSQKCIGCRKCIHEIGCPGIFFKDGKAVIDDSLCNGCGLCSQICPVSAIGGNGND